MLESVRAALARPVRRVAATLSPLGTGVVTLGVLCAVIGAALGWREADLIAVACGFALLLSAGYLVGTAQLSAEVELTRNRVEAGHNARVAAGELHADMPARAFVTVRNAGGRSSRWLTMEIPLRWSGGELIATVPIRIRPLAPGEEYQSHPFDLPTSRRGVIDVGPARVVRTDPLGLLRREVAWSAATEFVVHPRTVAVEQTGAGLLRDLEGQTSNDLSMNDLAFHALRDYEIGDSLRHVHALTSARLGRLMVRQFLDTRAAHLTVIVSGSPADYRDPADDEFEMALSAGSSLAVRALRDGQRVSILAAGRSRPAPRLTQRLALDAFSRARFGTPNTGLPALASHAIRIAPETSLAALVTGPGADIMAIRAAAARFGPGVRVVAIQVDPRSVPASQRAGRIRLLSVPELGDLRRAMQTAVSG